MGSIIFIRTTKPHRSIPFHNSNRRFPLAKPDLHPPPLTISTIFGLYLASTRAGQGACPPRTAARLACAVCQGTRGNDARLERRQGVPGRGVRRRVGCRPDHRALRRAAENAGSGECFVRSRARSTRATRISAGAPTSRTRGGAASRTSGEDVRVARRQRGQGACRPADPATVPVRGRVSSRTDVWHRIRNVDAGLVGARIARDAHGGPQVRAHERKQRGVDERGARPQRLARVHLLAVGGRAGRTSGRERAQPSWGSTNGFASSRSCSEETLGMSSQECFRGGDETLWKNDPRVSA
ncbi:hypothetical protein NFJ02_13g13700 [Pycnococcus provasolii]